jgi:hypothetical protein
MTQVVQNDRDYEEKLKNFISANNISCEHLSFEESCHSVAEAARAALPLRGWQRPVKFWKKRFIRAADLKSRSCGFP